MRSPTAQTFVVLSFLTILPALGCSRGDESSPPPPTPPPKVEQPANPVSKQELPEKAKPKTKGDVATAKAEFTTTVKDWLTEFKKDRTAAEKKYLGKIVELSGTVKTVVCHDNDLGAFVLLDNEGIIVDFIVTDAVGMSCDVQDPEPWLKLGPGSKVTIRGEGFGPRLSPATIVKVGPLERIEMKGEELAKEFSKDPKATQKKYKGQWILVDAEVVGKEAPKRVPGAVWKDLFLKGDGKIAIKGHLEGGTKYHDKRTESIVPGKRVKIVGEIAYDDGMKEITFPITCLLSLPK